MAGKKEEPKLPVKRKAVIETEPPVPQDEAMVEQVVEVAIEPFADPDKKTMAQLEDDMRKLVSQDISVEVELSANIWTFCDKGYPGQMGYSFKEYFRNRIGIGPTKAAALQDIWTKFKDLGIVEMKTLKGKSWLKLKALLPAIKAECITKRNVDTYLEYCWVQGKGKSLKLEDLEKLIKNLIAKQAKDDMDDSMRKVTFNIPAYDLETKNHFLELAKNVLKTDSDGNCWMTAAVEFDSNHATAADAQIWKARGLLAMKETMERLFNGKIAVLVHPIDPTVVPEDLQGVMPFTRIFQAYYDQAGDGVRELGFVIASNEAEAKQALGVKDVREFKISLAPSFAPKPIPAFKEPEKKEKPAKKGKAKAAKEKEDKPAEAEPKADGAKIKKIQKMSADEVRSAIRTIITEQSVPQADFEAKKEEFKKSPIAGLKVSQCLLYWLLEVKENAGKK